MVFRNCVLLAASVVLGFVSVSAAQVVSDTAQVKCELPGWCGSGTIAGVYEGGCFVTTNAHVSGTTIGRVVTIRFLAGGRERTAMGRVIAAFYRGGTAIDFAVLRVAGVSTANPIPILTDAATDASGRVLASPRCVFPLAAAAWDFNRRAGSILYGRPVSVGGQSGCGVVNAGRQIGIVTWSNGRDSMAQSGVGIWRALGGGELTALPVGCVEVVDEVAGRHSRPLTEDCFRWETSADVKLLPIWSHVGGGGGGDGGGECFVVSAEEKALIVFLRSQTDEVRSVDWIAVIMCLVQAL